MYANILEWLEESAKKYSDKIALYDEHQSLSYEQYYEKAVGIAEKICQSQIGTRKPVVVYLEKSIKVLASFMGIAYSGNFYSPLDIDMPKARIDKILEVLKPEAVITSSALKEKFESFEFKGKVLIYEEIGSKKLSPIVEKVKQRIIDTDLLYVLFTSGSTGTPKGVGITHRSVIDYTDWVVETFEITSEDSFGNQAPFYFDNSILDIYACLKTGASLYIIPPILFPQPVRLLEFLKEKQINTIFWVPSALALVSKLQAFRKVDLSKTLERVLFCGEVMPNKQLNIWRKYLPNLLYANLYGPTEITDACTYYIVDREFEDNESLPIGYPMKNTDILVLDEEDNLVSEAGVVGELCVRGTGVSVGYYNNPEKTREVFVQNPLNPFYPEIIYRTGDLVEYNQYGELIYLSRKDFQIKHLGHRIELGEIETAVASLWDITMCCCLYEEKKNRIVLFIDKNYSKEMVNEELIKMVPDYMLVGKVYYVEEMPLNANGKIDRSKLKEIME